ATIAAPAGALVCLTILDVPRVTVRGFRLDLGTGGVTYMTAILGHSPGTCFEKLEFNSPRIITTCAISIETIRSAKQEPPVTVRDCTINGFEYGVRVQGRSGTDPKLCRGVLVCGNQVSGCAWGLWTAGLIDDLLIVGNRVSGCSNPVELAGFTEGSSGI